MAKKKILLQKHKCLQTIKENSKMLGEGLKLNSLIITISKNSICHIKYNENPLTNKSQKR